MITQKYPQKSQNKPQIACLLHQETSTTGRVGQYLENSGYDCLYIKHPIGMKLPQLSENDNLCGIICFGGPMSVNDEGAFKNEIKWMEKAMKFKKPVLGICLGAQAINIIFGGTVYKNKNNMTEIGYYPIHKCTKKLTNNLQNDIKQTYQKYTPQYVYQWHNEGCSVNKCLETLTYSDGCFKNQSFFYQDKCIGVQFHPEVNYIMMRRWLTSAQHMLTMPNAKPLKQHYGYYFTEQQKIIKWLKHMLNNFFVIKTQKLGYCIKNIE